MEPSPSSPVDTRARIEATERWFVRRGIPHFTADYSVTDDIFTRAAPVLGLVLFAELFLTFGDRFSGWAQAGAFGVGLAVLVGVFVVVNRVRGRRPLQVPDDVGWVEIGAFVLVPPVLRLIAEASPVQFLGLVALQLMILGVVYVGASYGVVAMFLWSIGHFAGQVRHLGSLLVRVLPLMLVFSLFLFINAEVWQVASDLPGAYFAVVMVGLGGLVLVFVAWSLVGVARSIERISSWDEAAELTGSSPIGPVCPRGSAPPDVAPLSRRARVNVVLVLFVSRVAPVLLVTGAVFALYVGFGLLTIREDTILQWITDESLADADVLWRASWGGGEMVLTRQLLYVAAVIASVSGLQFAVSITTDPATRELLATDVTTEIREAVATRAAYLHLRRPPG